MWLEAITGVVSWATSSDARAALKVLFFNFIAVSFLLRIPSRATSACAWGIRLVEICLRAGKLRGQWRNGEGGFEPGAFGGQESVLQRRGAGRQVGGFSIMPRGASAQRGVQVKPGVAGAL